MVREIIRRNLDVCAAAKSVGVYLWEIADKLGVSEPTFIRCLRKELSEAMKAKLLTAIEEIKREHENEPRTEI